MRATIQIFIDNACSAESLKVTALQNAASKCPAIADLPYNQDVSIKLSLYLIKREEGLSRLHRCTPLNVCVCKDLPVTELSGGDDF